MAKQINITFDDSDDDDQFEGEGSGRTPTYSSGTESDIEFQYTKEEMSFDPAAFGALPEGADPDAIRTKKNIAREHEPLPDITPEPPQTGGSTPESKGTPAPDTEPQVIPQITGIPSAPAGAPPFDPKSKKKPIDVQKLVNQDISKETRDAARRLREEQAEQRRVLREQMQDEARQRSREMREARAFAGSNVTQIRSNAISARVQSYSVASVLGMSGYIGASLVDQFGIRPQEEAQIAAWEKYHEDLKNYQRQMEAERVRAQRQREAEARNAPVMATDVNKVRAARGLPPLPPGPVTASVVPHGPQRPDPGLPGGGPPREPPGGSEPPLVEPTPPAPVAPGGSGLGTGAFVAAAAFQGAQAFNQGIDTTGKHMQEVARSVFDDKPLRGIQSAAHAARSGLDPLGVGIPAQIAVTGMDTMIALTESIEKAAHRDLAFSPEALATSIEGEVNKMIRSIELAQKLDPMKAEVIAASGKLSAAWDNLQAELFEAWAPRIASSLETIAMFVAALAEIRDNATNMRQAIWEARSPLTMVLGALRMIARNTEKEAEAPMVIDFERQLRDFFDPANRGGAPANPPRPLPNPAPAP